MFRKPSDPLGGAITIFLDGSPVVAWVDDSVAAVLLRQSPVWSRMTPVSGIAFPWACCDLKRSVPAIDPVRTRRDRDAGQVRSTRTYLLFGG